MLKIIPSFSFSLYLYTFFLWSQ